MTRITIQKLNEIHDALNKHAKTNQVELDWGNSNADIAVYRTPDFKTHSVEWKVLGVEL